MKTNNALVKIVFLMLLGSLTIVSCNSAGEKYKGESISLETTGETKEFNSVAEEKPMISNSQNPFVDLKIIRNADIKIKVTDLKEASAFAKAFTETHLGYISDERMSNSNYSKESRFTIRVPQEHFDKVLTYTEELGAYVNYKNINTVDVTEKYVDISSRLKTKKEVQARYKGILRNKAKTVEEILQAEEKIRVLQEEIEAAEGKLRYMSSKVSFSTIQVNMYESVVPKDAPETYEPGFFDKAGDGLGFGWSLIENIGLAFIYLWPLLLLASLLVLLFKWWKKKKRKNL